jgi:hypothetical protein
VDGDTLAAPVITRDTVAVETDALLATSRIPMSCLHPSKARSGRQDRAGSSFSNFPYCPEMIGQVQPAVEYLNLQSITFPVF